MTILATLRQTGRAAVLAAVLAGTALSAAPAQAAPLKGFSLDVQPNIEKFEKGMNEKGMKEKSLKKLDPNAFFDWCLSDKQIRRGLRNYGFDDVEIVDHIGKNRVRVEAIWDDWYYSFRVHRCSGEVDKIKKLYPAWEDEDDDFPF